MIVEEVNYLCRPEDVAVIPGIAEAIAHANRREVAVVVVTNQAGVGRGYYDWDAFAAVQARILAELGAAGAAVDLVLACAYHAEGQGAYRRADHAWRKPGCGMLFAAAHVLGVELSASFIVGDRVSDLEAGRAAGLRAGALVASGYGAGEAREHADRLAAWRQDGLFRAEIGLPGPAAIRAWLDGL